MNGLATKAVVSRDVRSAAGLLKPNLFIRCAGALAERYLNHRGLMILYRGQHEETLHILSPIARDSGVQTSHEALTRYLRQGYTLEDIASEMAKYGPLGIGHVGIPTTRLPGIAAQPQFGRTVVYILRVPISQTTRAIGWQSLIPEQEYMLLHDATPFKVGTLRPDDIPIVGVDEQTSELYLIRSIWRE
ncbi:hypothetical protein HYR99_22420 [Candidatus Poribacteria bacterium]|nr:hypothetical protein [Candidatus Poribacteria bacterium]